MRTLTGQQTALYANIYGAQSDRFTVEVYIGAAWTDLTNLIGFNWVQSLTYGGDQDSPFETAAVRLFTQIHDSPRYSISPYASNSVLNASGTVIQLHRKFRIRAASTSMGHTPADSELAVVFLGRIYAFDINQQFINLECRDESAILQDRFIEVVREYSQDGATAVETVMQAILDDHYNAKVYKVGGTTPDAVGDTIDLFSVNGTAATPFNVGDSPGWLQRLLKQQRQPVLDALRILADQIGWRCRWRYFASDVNSFALVFEAPDRTGTTSLLTIPYQRVIQYGPVRQSLTSIRNVCAIGYDSGAGERVLNQGGAAFPNGENTTSIDAVGRRWVEIQEDSASQIDTAAEANTMSDRILYDLQHGLESFEITIPYLLPIQYGDIITIPADNVISDTDRKHSVIGYQHESNSEGAKTTLTLRGASESSQTFLWIARQADQPTRTTPLENNIFETSLATNMVANGDFGAVSRR